MRSNELRHNKRQELKSLIGNYKDFTLNGGAEGYDRKE